MNQQIHQIGVRLLKLRARLRARENTPGFDKNCVAIRQEIARLEAATISELDDQLAKAKVKDELPVASKDQSGD